MVYSPHGEKINSQLMATLFWLERKAISEADEKSKQVAVAHVIVQPFRRLKDTS